MATYKKEKHNGLIPEFEAMFKYIDNQRDSN